MKSPPTDLSSPELILSLVVNDEPRRCLVPANRSLLDFLREDLHLTGTKHGCDVGDCGACTVLVGGAPRLSCITLAVEVEGASVRTIEGLAQDGVLHPIQEALHRHIGAQCGYCTPGVALCLAALLDEDPEPSDRRLEEALSSNICRCTGYGAILRAARDVIENGGEALAARGGRS
jgi:carbon-monoxide dehydrogenase small subunit